MPIATFTQHGIKDKKLCVPIIVDDTADHLRSDSYVLKSVILNRR